MIRLLVNPFFAYMTSFLAVIIVYLAGWSELYPALNWNLIAFIVGTSLLALAMGLRLEAHGLLRRPTMWAPLNFPFYTKLVYLLFVIEIAFNGKIPLLEMLMGRDYNYQDFSFPFLHLILTTFTAFLCNYAIYSLLQTKEKKYLFYFFLNLSVFMLLMYRSYVVIIFLNALLLYLMHYQLRAKRVLAISVAAVLLIYLFGAAGDLRTQAQIGGGSNFDVLALKEVTRAAPDIARSENNLLNVSYWGYLYISSPLANLQQTINRVQPQGLSEETVTRFAVYEVLPDIVGKRIAVLAGWEEHFSPLSRIISFLTVGTIYGDAYWYFGWFGMGLMFLLLIMFITVYIRVLPSGPYFAVGMTSLAFVVCLCTFSNMLVYTSLGLQLVYPIIFHYARSMRRLARP